MERELDLLKQTERVKAMAVMEVMKEFNSSVSFGFNSNTEDTDDGR
jgi:hypothetical protein